MHYLQLLINIILYILFDTIRGDPGFFLEEGATLRNGATDWWGKQILKANTKKTTSSQGGGGGVNK